jgi:hypothetical protein
MLFSWFKIGSSAGSCEYNTELSLSIKGGQFLDQLRDCQPLEKHSLSWRYLTFSLIIHLPHLGIIRCMKITLRTKCSISSQPVSDWLPTGRTRFVLSTSMALLSLLTRSECLWSQAPGHSLFYLQYFNFDRAFFTGLWLIHYSRFRH